MHTKIVRGQKMVVLTCPNCGASMQIEENRQFAFCTYCGTKIANLKNTVEIDRGTDINNLLMRALEFEARGDYTRSLEYCNRVLDMDPQNQMARALENRLPNTAPAYNVTIVYRSDLDDRFKLRISTDGRSWTVLDPNGRTSLSLPVGVHRIVFSGKKLYTQTIKVTNPRQSIVITYHAGRMKNDITMTVR